MKRPTKAIKNTGAKDHMTSNVTVLWRPMEERMKRGVAVCLSETVLMTSP
jgi:hypothetical protein